MKYWRGGAPFEHGASSMMDVAIIGGGVAGCYCAYRLAMSGSFPDIRLFETSGRIGGRLWSVPLDGVGSGPAELGGMFFSDSQQNVLGLVKEFELSKTMVNFKRNHQFLRSKILLDSTYTDSPDSVPYFLRPEERGKDPATLLFYTLRKIVPEIESLWPESDKGTPGATMNYLREFAINGRPLHDWGFWNLISGVLSNEAYELLTSTLGTTSTFRNSNALDSIWNILAEEAGNNWYRLSDGYQQLPLTLESRCADRVRFHKDHRLTGIGRDGKTFVLQFEGPGVRKSTLEARRVILALPLRALQMVAYDAAILGSTSFHDDLNTVIPIDACKVLLKFPVAWWKDANLGADFSDPTMIATSYTDLPMEQCYYYSAGKDGQAALLMATYSDGVSTSFWSGLVSSKYGLRGGGRSVDGGEELCASEAMVEAALAQLRLMHPGTTIPEPTGALFFDWLKDPHGAAWHAWAPCCKSWEVSRRIRKPNPELALFVCGEAVGQMQGWTEGAINSAEMVLKDHFGLSRPAWVAPDYVFEF
jgi:monoamine oxidase